MKVYNVKAMAKYRDPFDRSVFDRDYEFNFRAKSGLSAALLAARRILKTVWLRAECTMISRAKWADKPRRKAALMSSCIDSVQTVCELT